MKITIKNIAFIFAGVGLIIGSCYSFASFKKEEKLTLPIAVNKVSPSVIKQKTARPVLITGEVQVVNSQVILVPSTNVNPVPIRFFVPEGTHVKAGDIVLRIDSQADGQAEQIELQLVQARENSYKEVAELEIKKIEADKLLVQAKAALGKAKIDASLPKEQISALDYDKYQGEIERAKRDLEVKEKALENAKEAIVRKQEDGVLAVKKFELQLAQSKVQQEEAEVRAKRDGVVIHGYSSWSGVRIDEGGQAPMGDTAGRIVSDGQQVIVAWILEADRHFVSLNQTMKVRFDAIPDRILMGTLKRLSSAPEARTVWGKGRYFKAEIHLPANHGVSLFNGMSAMIEPASSDVNPLSASTSSQKEITTNSLDQQRLLNELAIEGEVLSRLSSAITTPSIRNVWQFNLVMLKPEGSMVKKGEPIAIFEVEEVITRLNNTKSSFNEKQKALDKQGLDHAEAEKANVLAVSEAKSNAEKALRKASLPKELIKRIDYDKLVIERVQFEDLAKLSVIQLEAQRRARKAEKRGLQTELDKIQNMMNQLQRGINELTVVASRPGMVLHVSNDEGEKTAVGNKVFKGSSVATLADPEKLYIAAKVPEAQVSHVTVGQAAKVTITGANVVLGAKIISMGQVFHSKSKNQPNIVRDIELEFDAPTKVVKPGSAVQVSLVLNKEKAKK